MKNNQKRNLVITLALSFTLMTSFGDATISSTLSSMDTAAPAANSQAASAPASSSSNSSNSYKSWTGYVVSTAKPYLNVRTGVWGSIVDAFKPGTAVTVVGVSGEWYIIKAGGAKRYVYAKYITKNKPAAASKPAYSPWTGYVVSTAKPYLNVRKAAWGTIVDKLKPGASVKVINKSGDWYVIEGNKYVYAKYITKTKPAASSGYASWTGYVNTAALNVRTAPWGTKVDCYTKGKAVKVIGKSNDWYKISANGKTLYVHSDYISKTKPSSGGSSGSSSGSVGKGWGGRPVAGGWISSKYGYRKDPFGSGATKFHSGVDYAVAGGTPVKSLGPGKVLYAGWGTGYGNYVKIQHDNGYVSYCAHLKSCSVKSGQRVGQGTVIGKVNSTGSSTGNHLHFELRKNGSTVNPASVPGVQL